MEWNETLGRTLLGVGLLLAVVGLLLLADARIPWLGRLPGDLHVERDGFRFSVPITTCLLISALLTLLLYLFGRFSR